jgi:hypothetical protein
MENLFFCIVKFEEKLETKRGRSCKLTTTPADRSWHREFWRWPDLSLVVGRCNAWRDATLSTVLSHWLIEPDEWCRHAANDWLDGDGGEQPTVEIVPHRGQVFFLPQVTRTYTCNMRRLRLTLRYTTGLANPAVNSLKIRYFYCRSSTLWPWRADVGISAATTCLQFTRSRPTRRGSTSPTAVKSVRFTF